VRWSTLNVDGFRLLRTGQGVTVVYQESIPLSLWLFYKLMYLFSIFRNSQHLYQTPHCVL
jgi:hypothetical protein